MDNKIRETTISLRDTFAAFKKGTEDPEKQKRIDEIEKQIFSLIQNAKDLCQNNR